MIFDRIVDYFLPVTLRNNKTHDRYDEFRVVVSSSVISLPVIAVFPLFLWYLDKPFAGYYINLVLIMIMLYCIRLFAHYRIPMTILAAVTYAIIYDFIKDTGLIYSTHVGVLHVFLLAAIWVDKKWGWYTIITNLFLFGFIYYKTLHTEISTDINYLIGSPLYAFILHSFISVLLGVFLAYEQADQERNRKKIRTLQDKKIDLLDDVVKQRTAQLNNMRQIMAADFHDETGNMLSAITRQASTLQLKLNPDDATIPMIESIITNSNELYARSKDFLWNLNHDSDDPAELFQYLTAYGQQFYNQFDIAFSSEDEGMRPATGRLDIFASLNLIFIFKEAMTNVVKHANATEVILKMSIGPAHAMFSLNDNGSWKEIDTSKHHYGLDNIRRRCGKNAFQCNISTGEGSTVTIIAPLSFNIHKINPAT